MWLGNLADSTTEQTTMTRKPDPGKLVRVTHTIREDQLTALDRLAIELYSDRSKLIRRAVDELIQREKKK